MQNLRARTEVHEALAHLALAEEHISNRRYREALDAALSAERLCRQATSVLEYEDSTIEKIAEAAVRARRLLSEIRIQRANTEQPALRGVKTA